MRSGTAGPTLPTGVTVHSSRCLHGFVRRHSSLFPADVNKSAAPFLNPEQRQQDLAPILDGSIDPADLESVVSVVNPQTLRATAAPQRVIGGLLAYGGREFPAVRIGWCRKCDWNG
jgi:hypothetical protein